MAGNAKFCITKCVIFSFIYLMIQGGGRWGSITKAQDAHIGFNIGGVGPKKWGPEGVKFGSHDI